MSDLLTPLVLMLHASTRRLRAGLGARHAGGEAGSAPSRW